MRGDWLSSWSGLTSARSIGRDERNELSIGKRGRVGLVSRIVPYVWSSDVIETWRGVGSREDQEANSGRGRVHDRQFTLRALPKVQDGPEIEFIGALTLYRDVKDTKVTAVQII